MNGSQLCRQLGISESTLREFVRRGLPVEHHGRRRAFDPAAVRAWLLESGEYSQRRICTTQAELADCLGVSERMVGYYRGRQMPGRPGHWDLDEIEPWLERQGLRTKQGSDKLSHYRTELVRVRTETAELALEEKRGQVVSVEMVKRLFLRHVAEAKQTLSQFSDQVAKDLPEKTPKRYRARILRRAQEAVDATLHVLSRLLEEQAKL